jgi:hypothetical protein
MYAWLWLCIYRFMRRWMDLSKTGDTPNSWPSWWGKSITLPDKISMPRVASDNANRMLKYSKLWLPTSWLINIAMEIHVSHSDFFLLVHGSSISFCMFSGGSSMRRRTAKAPPRTFHLCPLTIVGEDPQPRSTRQGSAGDVFDIYSDLFGATVGIEAEV